jgi:hypothetical protein
LYKIKNQAPDGAESKNAFCQLHHSPELLPAKLRIFGNLTDNMSNAVTMKITGSDKNCQIAKTQKRNASSPEASPPRYIGGAAKTVARITFLPRQTDESPTI